MTNRSRFEKTFGNLSSNGNHVRVIALVGFMCLMTLAVGVPLLGRSRTVEVPEVKVEPTAVPMIDVFMPLSRIPAGSPLMISQFKKERMNAIAVSALGGQVLRSEADYVGKFAKTVILPGRPLMGDQLIDAPDNAILRKIKPGFRAVTIKVDDVTGIEGWSAPGARVDVLWITQKGDEPVVSSIVKNVQVLSVMGRTEARSASQESGIAGQAGAAASFMTKPSGPGSMPAMFTVTLLVSPDDGQRIMLANSNGKLSMMLRGEFDNGQDSGAAESLTSSKLLGMDRPSDSTADQLEGTARVKREDGSYDEWSVIEGRVQKWDKAH